jgi:hypothetical protein
VNEWSGSGVKSTHTLLLVAVTLLACSFYGRPLYEVVERRVLLPVEQLHELEQDPNPLNRSVVLGLPQPYWDPSVAQLRVCEGLLSKQWARGRRYDLQYMGLTVRGQPVVFLQGFCSGHIPEEELALFPIISMDAGRCAFSARCYPAQKRISSFHFDIGR